MWTEDTDRDFFAGWFDGVRFAKHQRVREVRRELQRFSLTLDANSEPIPLAAGEIPSVSPLPPREKPSVPGSSYAEGYRQGYEIGLEEITETLRQRLEEHDLDLLLDGTVIALNASDSALAPLPEATAPLTDDVLHAFLDNPKTSSSSNADESGELDLAPDRASESPAHATPSPRSRFQGALQMVIRTMRRRRAIAAMAGMVGTAITLGVLNSGTRPAPAPTTAVVANEVSAPPPWHALHPTERVAYDALHGWVSGQEAAGNTSAAMLECLRFMATPLDGRPTVARTKTQIVAYLSSTHRYSYAPTLAPLFVDQSASNRDLIWPALLFLSNAKFTHGAAAIPPSIRTALLSLLANKDMSTAQMRSYVGKLLEMD